MENSFSNEPFEIACPACQKPINKPIAWFKKDIVACPFCKTMIHTRKFRSELETAENALAKSRRQL